MRLGLITEKQIDSLPHDRLRDSFRELAGTTPLMDEVKQYKTAGAFRTALETDCRRGRRWNGRLAGPAQASRLDRFISQNEPFKTQCYVDVRLLKGK